MRTLWVEAKCFQHVNKNTPYNECARRGKWKVESGEWRVGERKNPHTQKRLAVDRRSKRMGHPATERQRRTREGKIYSRSLTSVRKQRDRVRDDNSRKLARGGRGTIGNFGRDRGGRLGAFGVYDSLGRRGELRVTIRGFGASELYQALRSVEQTGDVYVG